VNGADGSIPVVDTIGRELGMDCVLLGFGLDDDQVHSPNEKFEQRCPPPERLPGGSRNDSS